MTASSSPEQLLALPADLWDPATPPHFDEQRRSWQLFAYDDVRRALTDAEFFSRDYGDPEEDPTAAMMWAADDPRHHDLRSLVADPFRQSMLRELTPAVEEIVDDLIDQIVASGSESFDAVAAFGRTLPNRV